MLWAALLQARLTQTKEQNKKLKWRARMFSVEVRMIQGEGRSGEFTASKQDFASPSKIPWFHPSLIASCTAQIKASDSAKRGEATFVILAKILMGTPWWSLATAARQAWEVDIAASTLIFDPNRGGGIQEGWSALVYAGGEQTRARESSLNLLWMAWMEDGRW